VDGWGVRWICGMLVYLWRWFEILRKEEKEVVVFFAGVSGNLVGVLLGEMRYVWSFVGVGMESFLE
jgi:hypothetical protein